MPIMPKPKVKDVFFDRKIIKRNWKVINESPLKKAGLVVRKVARQSIRRGKTIKTVLPKNKRKPSPAGRPPKSWKSGKTPPFKMIYSVPEKLGTSVVVGMIGFGKASGSTMPVPGLMEHGGTARRRVFVKAGQRRTKKGRFGRIFRKPVVRSVRYPERAFMNPALKKVRTKLPHYWKGAFNPGRIKGAKG